MDKRLIFRYRSRTIKSAAQVRGGVGRASPIGDAASKPAVAGFGRDARGGQTARRPRAIRLSLASKKSRAAGSRERPYRKPTLVAGCESTKVDG